MRFWSLTATRGDYARLPVLFRIPALIGGAFLLGLAVAIVVQGPTELRTVGPVGVGQPVSSTLEGSVAFDVFVSTAQAGDARCRDADGALASTMNFPIPGDRVIDGSPWFGTAAKVELRGGQTVTCTVDGAGQGQVLLVHRTGLVRLLQAVLFGVVGLIGLVFGLVGVRAARRAQGATS
jgi:hypothetical protein